jgi:ribosomal protein L15
LKNLTDSEKDLQQKVILDAEIYAVAVRSAVARAASRSALAEIESEEK